MNKKIGNIFKGDKVIWIVLFILCMISIVEVFSASSNLTYKSNNYIMPIMKHAATIIAGVMVAIVFINIPCRYFKLFTPLLIFISLFTLIWVLVAGEDINGASRVIEIGGQTFQPSEIAKGTVILSVAQILSAMQTEKGADKKAFHYIMFITVPLAGLIMVENLSTAALLCLVVLLMMIIGRVPAVQIGKLLAFVFACVFAVFSFVMLVGHDKAKEDKNLSKEEIIEKAKGEEKEDKGMLAKVFHRADTWKGRIDKFMDPDTISPAEYDLDKDAQVAHANIAIVSSNIIGKGPGNSVERDFLSQAFSDFIYAIIIEEMGIGGALLVVFLYIVLLFRAARIASRCENNFPAFLVMGLSLLLVVQATFNMLVAVGFVPVTGQPLPLISKGGTSTIINCAYIGAILSVSRWAAKKKTNNTNPDNGNEIPKAEGSEEELVATA